MLRSARGAARRAFGGMSSSDTDDSWSLDDVDIGGARAAEHFKFDPLASEESDSNEAAQHDDPEAWRLGNTDW